MTPLLSFATRHPVLAYLAVTGLLAALFIAFPGLDIAAAHLFYSAEDGFFLKDSALAEFSYDLILRLENLIYILAAFLVLAHLVPALRALRARPAVIACIVLAFGLGPGLVTNALLKNEMGRARPAQVMEFGGTKAFTPAAIPADQCESNCSFVTGHGAFAFGFSVFAFLMAPGAWRRRTLVATVAFGALVGLGRMVQGGHWLSDVIFAGLVNVAIAWAVCELLLYRNGFDRLTAPLRAAFAKA